MKDEVKKYTDKALSDAESLKTELVKLDVVIAPLPYETWRMGFNAHLGDESEFISVEPWHGDGSGVKIIFGDYGRKQHWRKKGDGQFDFPKIALRVKEYLESEARRKADWQKASEERLRNDQAKEAEITWDSRFISTRQSDGRYRISLNDTWVTVDQLKRLDEILSEE